MNEEFYQDIDRTLSAVVIHVLLLEVTDNMPAILTKFAEELTHLVIPRESMVSP